MVSDATLSECGTYRYLLWRIWNPEKWKLAFVMLNPSTAGPSTDDPTIRRCMRFASANNYGGIFVANLFAYRSTDPANLPKDESAIGPHNDSILASLAEYENKGFDIVFAWGTKGILQNRDKAVAAMFSNPYCLELTKEGHPKHPLYVRSDIQFQTFKLDHGK